MFSRLSFILPFVLLSVSCKTKSPSRSSSIEPNSAVIINGGDNNIDVLDLNSLKIKGKIWLKTDGNTFSHHIYFSKSRKYVSIALPYFDFSKGHDGMHHMSVPGKVIVLNTSDGKVKVEIEVPQANHNAIISPDEKEIWTAGMSHSGRVYVYDIETGNLKNQIVVDADPSEIIFSRDEKYAVVSCGESSFVTVIDIAAKTIIKEIKVDPNPGNVWPGFDNSIFVENSVRKTLNIVDLNALKAVDFIDFDFTPGFMVYNPKNREIWVCSKSDDNVYIFKKGADKWEKTATFASSNGPHMIAFSDQFSKVILINQFGNTAIVINAETKKEIKRIATGSKPNGIAVWE